MWSALRELTLPSVCPACDAPRHSGEQLLCPSCTAGLSPLDRLGEAHTVFAYEGTALRLLRRLKFEGRRDGLAPLARAAARTVARLRSTGTSVDAVVPLPPHEARVRELGCDPVFDLSRAVAAACGLPLRADALARTRRTTPQKQLGSEARRQNLSDSFAARSGRLTGQAVLLLDDITTTGATLVAGGRELRDHSGATRVVLAAIAGTLPERGRPLPTPPPPAV